MPGWWLASGDHCRLTGSGSTLEMMCYINGRVYLLTYFTSFDINVRMETDRSTVVVIRPVIVIAIFIIILI